MEGTNRRYRILESELARAMSAKPGPKARVLTDLTRPTMDWAALAKGFGVPTCTARTDSGLNDPLTRSFAERGPTLMEAILA